MIYTGGAYKGSSFSVHLNIHTSAELNDIQMCSFLKKR